VEGGWFLNQANDLPIRTAVPGAAAAKGPNDSLTTLRQRTRPSSAAQIK
jgi:hypothetical protein